MTTTWSQQEEQIKLSLFGKQIGEMRLSLHLLKTREKNLKSLEKKKLMKGTKAYPMTL